VRRLVRDPYTRLGGVASGIAHHYGIDVSIVRILFVLAVFASGTGLLAYLLAWLIIPRAEYWPPQGPARSIRSLSGRDLGLVLALGGVAFAIAIGGGAGGILIPLVLVGGGVWLLVQPSPGPEAASAEGYRATGYPPPPDAYAAAPAGAAVPPRSGRRRIVLMTVFGLAIGLLVLLPLGIAGTVAVLIATDTIDFDEPPTITFRPTSVDALPAAIDEDSGRIVIDLTALDTAELADQSERPVIDADVDFGEITVIVPDDLDVTVDADVSLGDVHVFGEHEDGFRPNITRADPDADLDLVLDVGLGEIRVERAAAS
jgi:phage shock protein PspC (stress-responsive transcriptional regulator)